MAKNKNTKSKTSVQCKCSRCDQVATAQEGTIHHYCKGIHPRILASFPEPFKGMTNPTKKGTWQKYIAPPKVVEEPEVKAA